MIKELYANHDMIHGYYNIGTFVNELDAIRVFKWTLAKDELPDFVKNDLELVRIGTFDTESGDLFCCEPTVVYKGVDFIE